MRALPLPFPVLKSFLWVATALALGAGSCDPPDTPQEDVDTVCDVTGGCPGQGDTNTTSSSGGSVTPGSSSNGGTASTWPAAWATLEEEVVVEVNRRRAAGATCDGVAVAPVGALSMQSNLRLSARLHSKDMADQNYFSHTGLDGRSPFDRMRDAGYTNASIMAENIAGGATTAAQVVQQWMDSPGHCRNIMDGRLREIGVGYALNAAAAYRHYWTQNFGG